MSVIIRDITEKDIDRVTEIYSYYVENTAISFEYVSPTALEFAQRVQRITESFPFLVAEKDGTVLGYAYASTFIPRAAYDRCCEVTVYLDHTAKKQGLGKALYAQLEKRLADMGIINLYACIADPEVDDEYVTKNSRDFHSHMGYRTVGTFYKSGYKFGRWYDMIYMEKLIGVHADKPEEVEKYRHDSI